MVPEITHLTYVLGRTIGLLTRVLHLREINVRVALLLHYV